MGFSIFGGEPGDFWAYLLGSLIFINILLAAFNLIPVAPLDGFKVVQGLLPRDAALQWSRLERWGPLILMILVLSGFILPTGSLLRAHHETLGQRACDDHHWWTDLGLIWFNL